MKKVFVGMSGGVDSAVAAALLKKAGDEVTGVFIRAWEPPGLVCSWREDRREAMRVAARLEIPLKTLDLSAEYKRAVVDYLVAEYRAGRTPNPDVECNRAIKFGEFFNWARARGADFVATGHYVRKVKGQKSKVKILQARDQNKDQSYFLWTLTQDQLKHCLFPIGDYQKSAVRDLARKFKLPNWDKKDSQGLCFIGQIDLKSFLKERIKPRPGPVVSSIGEVIGRHEGAALYTIGERHGFTVGKKTASDQPYYVVGKNIKTNTLVVSIDRREQNIKEVNLENVNWLAGQAPPAGVYRARVRHLGELSPVHLDAWRPSGASVTFDRPPFGLAPGQSLVLYQKDVLLGGGVIQVQT